MMRNANQEMTMTTTRRDEILAALENMDDGTGTLGLIVDAALRDDPETTASDIREIVYESMAEHDANIAQEVQS